jgi:hypothetical protein
MNLRNTLAANCSQPFLVAKKRGGDVPENFAAACRNREGAFVLKARMRRDPCKTRC